MSYKILYDPALTDKFPQKKNRKDAFLWLAIISAFMFVVLVMKTWYDNDIFLTTVETKAAVTKLMDDLRAGEPMMEAFSDFCVNVIENENKADR